MSDEIERLLVRVEANASQFEAQMKKLNRTLYGVAAENRKTLDRMKRDAERAGKELGTMLGNGIGQASLIAGTAFAAISAYSVKLASDAAEIRNAFDVAFKESAKSARAFADVLSEKVGRDSIEVQEAMSRLQLVITGTGVAAQQSTELVKALTARAIDVGSLFNVKDSEAFAAMVSGLTGETEPLKKFGVVLNETAVKAELLRLGFKGNAEQASEAAKSIARANLILEKTKVAQGDAAKTADGAANSAKRMKAEFNKAARELGETLLPHVTAAAQAVTGLVKTFNDMPSGVQIAGLAILGFIAAGGPIAGLLANLGKVIKLAQAARAAMIGVTGTSAVAGAAGVAGAGGGGALSMGAVAGPPGVVAAAGVGAWMMGSAREEQYKRVLKNPKAASDADLELAIQFARSNGTPARGAGPAGDRQRAIWAPRLSKLLNEQFNRGLDGGGGGSSGVDTSPVGGFTLSEDLKNPTGGGGGGRGRGGGRGASGATEAELKARRETLELEHQIALARASGDSAKLKALEDEQVMQRDIEALKSAGYSTSEAETIALLRRIQLNEAQIRQAERLAELKAVDVGESPTLSEGLGPESQRMAEDEAALRETFQRTFGDGVRAALRGDLDGFFMSLADRFSDRLINNLSDQLFTLLSQIGQQSSTSGNGNWFTAAIGAVGNMFSNNGSTGTYAGGYATGGSFPSGKWATVGEQGAEAIYAKPGGGVQVLSNGALRSLRSNTSRPMAARPASVMVVQPFQPNLSGAVMTEQLLGQMKQMADASGVMAYRQAVDTTRRGAPGIQQRLNMLGTP